jgi:hypothetical protein
MTPSSQKLLHLLRTVRADAVLSAQLVELLGSALLASLPRNSFPVFADDQLFFAC